jgi:prenyltransferase beta subunit
LAEENCDWIFVNMVPLLCEKARIAKQQKVETWLTLHQLAAQLGLQGRENRENRSPITYLI